MIIVKRSEIGTKTGVTLSGIFWGDDKFRNHLYFLIVIFFNIRIYHSNQVFKKLF